MVYITTEITTHPVDIAAVVSQNITLTCSASVDDAAYRWYRVNNSIPIGSTGHSTNMLTIHSASSVDGGIYYCIASKEGVSVESNRASVTVNSKYLAIAS